MRHKPWKYLSLALLTVLVGCQTPGLRPVIPSTGDSITRTATPGVPSEVAITIRWPYRAQVLPTSSQRLSLQLSGPTSQTVDVFRPEGTAPSSTATMSVDVGTGYTLRAEAYDSAPTPRLVASGTSTAFDVRANERTSVTIGLTPVFVPTVTGFSPDNGGPGSTVEVYGTHFGQDRGLKPGFTFNGVAATTVYPPQEGTVSVLVPTSATSGLIVPMVDGVTGTGSGSFTVLKQLGISPQSATVASGSSVLFTALATTSENAAFTATPSVSWTIGAPLSSTSVSNYRIQAGGDQFPEAGTGSIALGSFDRFGRFTASATGTAYVTILSGTLLATASVTVTD